MCDYCKMQRQNFVVKGVVKSLSYSESSFGCNDLRFCIYDINMKISFDCNYIGRDIVEAHKILRENMNKRKIFIVKGEIFENNNINVDRIEIINED